MSRGTTSSVGVCGSRDDGDVTEQVDIDVASREDLAEIVAIRNAVAATSIASFDTRPASVADQLPWFDRTVSTGPYRILVARRAGRVLGYASSGRYREHEAFVRTVEVGIGLHADSRGQGIGSRLYRVLFDYLAGQPVHVAVAGIALPNDASVALHRRFGFREVGVFHEYAIKNGQYLSSLWLEKVFTEPA
jgi:phosphinothricin acetyltransferase